MNRSSTLASQVRVTTIAEEDIATMATPHDSRVRAALGEPLCPSGRCAVGSMLTGLVGPNGTVQQLRTVIPVDALFVRDASRGREPDLRFRFTEPCAGGGCLHDTGGRCGLIDRVLESDVETNPPAGSGVPMGVPTLVPCPIRSRCVWFAQHKAAACAVCPTVTRGPFPHQPHEGEEGA
jgi:hypothetical protein